MSDEKRELKSPIPAISIDPHFKLFSFFNITELQRMKRVNTAWRDFIPFVQRRSLHPSIRWYVDEGLMSMNTAAHIHHLWNIPLEERAQHIPKWLVDEFNRFEMNNDWRGFLINDTQLLVLLGGYLS